MLGTAWGVYPDVPLRVTNGTLRSCCAELQMPESGTSWAAPLSCEALFSR